MYKLSINCGIKTNTSDKIYLNSYRMTNKDRTLDSGLESSSVILDQNQDGVKLTRQAKLKSTWDKANGTL